MNTDFLLKKIEASLTEASADFERGFFGEAPRKRAISKVSYAYDKLREIVMNEILEQRGMVQSEETEEQKSLTALYWAVPNGLHTVRERHFEMFKGYPIFAKVREMIALREAMKAAELIPYKTKSEEQEKADRIVKTIRDEIEARKAQFIEGLEVARLFNGLPVSVNAHIVHGHKGTVFVRHFFYLRGELTRLQTLIAVSEAYAAEQKAAAR